VFPHETAQLFIPVFRTPRLNLAIVLCSPASERLAYWRKPQLLAVESVQLCRRYLSWDSSRPSDSAGHVRYPCPFLWRNEWLSSRVTKQKVLWDLETMTFLYTVDVKNCSREIMRWLKFTIFWGVTPFKYVAIHRRFGRSYCFHPQGKRVG